MKRLLLILTLAATVILSARAEIRLPVIMGDNMVLQQNTQARLWGWAERGGRIIITVSWNKEKYITTADEHGKWIVSVNTPSATRTPQYISIREGKGKPTTIENVLIGEVWLCSGQSNMQMQMRGYRNQPVEGAQEEIVNSGEFCAIRMVTIPKRAALERQEIVDGEWKVPSPENTAQFSAAAWFFARRIERTLDVPVGIISCSWGGSSIAGWMPEELLDELGYRDTARKAKDESLKNGRPTVMYNGMLYPIHDYTIKGFLWYQGCSDVADYKRYAQYQTAMVRHWRKLWGLGELPFYFVEIAPFNYAGGKKGYMLREQQQKCLDMIPSCGMASTADLVKPYECKIIHPSRKKEVGERLALLALEHSYGIMGLHSDAPRFSKMELQKDGTAKLSFTNCDNGLSADGSITGFEASGRDGIFFPAQARVLKDSRVLVSCPQVGKITEVRYLYHNFVPASLHSNEGLPVLQFRTDSLDEEMHISRDIPERAKEILGRISAPSFRKADYNIMDFGAVADSTIDSREALNNAISACSGEGGGQVIVPTGKYLCKGPLTLKSNVNLHLSEGATIYFSENPKDYLPAVLTVWEGTEMFNYSPFVRAYHCENIAITGKGTLNGRASGAFAKMRPQRSAMQDKLRQMGSDGSPVCERNFGDKSIMPPNMIEPFGCRNVLIEGITILDSPFWVIHPTFCDNVTVRGVTIESYNKNNDGCDPEYSRDVLIEDCTFRCGDDAIAIKAGRDADAWKIGRRTSGIIIRNCRFFSRCNGLCIGSEMSAGVEDVFMYDTKIEHCANGIYFKSNLDRGGTIRNIWVRGIDCAHVKTAFISFYTNYHGARGGNFPTTFENFEISDVRGGKSELYGFYLVGIKGRPMKNIRLRNVSLEEAPKPYVLQYAENISFNNVRINGIIMPERPEETTGHDIVLAKD